VQVDTGVACTPWAPLAAGILARVQDAEPSVRVKADPFQKTRYHKSGDDEVVANVREVARQRGLPPAQVALAWLLQKQGVAAPVVGASKPQHIEDAVKATQLKLTEEEVRLIEQAYLPHAVSGHV
jgi:aryl-alcohol dehydrogenase-like predicted oxidoreductase